MKTLYLVRHAKSDWADEDLSDIDRPLNKRGYRDAHFMSGLMKEKKLLPDLIITSPAIRAITTALIFCKNFNFNYSDIVIDSNLYETNVQQYKSSFSKIDSRYSSIMLFGHNPTISDLANSLTKTFTETIATCGIVGIRQSENCKEWKCFNDTNGELILYDFPKNHIEKQ
ncbi:MAG: histidine phosphatase family protein [Bacteroidota bacterium]